MATERNQHRISSLLTRVACGFATFILALILSPHYNPLGPNISPADLDSHPIVVAKIEIPAGSRIIAEQLQVTQLPRSMTTDGAFTRIDGTIVGRVAVTRIGAREPITESQLAPVGSAAALSPEIPEGYRGMTVRVDEVVGSSGFIQPQTRVDVVVIEPPNRSAQHERVSRIVLQNVLVLASAQTIGPPTNEKPAKVTTATLQVTAEQAEKLALASSEGKLQLVIRDSKD